MATRYRFGDNENPHLVTLSLYIELMFLVERTIKQL